MSTIRLDAGLLSQGNALDASSDSMRPGADAVRDQTAAVPEPDAPELYLNRELTWFAFNRRVLSEAQEPRTPLLERLKFLALTAANLDEFFMRRIGGLKQQVAASFAERTVDGRTPEQQITECLTEIRAQERAQRALARALLAELAGHGIQVTAYEELPAAERAALREHYVRNVFPLVTPLAMDPAHPFPFISNLSLNLLITLRYPNDSEQMMARIKVPVGTGIPRFFHTTDGMHLVPLEEIVAHNLDLLFPAMEVDACESFRVTRNANTERDEEEADDLLAMIESELRDRRLAPTVRLEVSAGMNPSHRGMLTSAFGLDEGDVFEVDGMMALRVTYGVVGLKTHCKVLLIVRQEYDGLRRYAHIGTGNYHPGTARIYSDLGLLTCDPIVGQDLTELFNYLTTGYRPKRAYHKILPAPTHLKKALLAHIVREIAAHGREGAGHIRFKMNALEDVDVVHALYDAARAGVRIDLIVRDTCRLRPGVPGLSENVRVVSVVGRFLEHARIYYFHNGGDEEFLIGSADCMNRNLESRVEVVVPVEDPALREELRAMLDAQLAPGRGSWTMQADGTYVPGWTNDDRPSCQQVLIDLAAKRQRQGTRRRRRRPRVFARRPGR